MISLKPAYMKQVQKLLKQYVPRTEVWAYGSRVSGNCHEASDLDLVLRDPRELSRHHKNLYELKEAFAESNLPILVDILDWARLPDNLHTEIEKSYVVIQKG